MLVVADVNAIWRAKPFEALGRSSDVVGLSPVGFLSRLRGRDGSTSGSVEDRGRTSGYERWTVPLFDGWSTVLSSWEQPRMWRGVVRRCERDGRIPVAVVVTTPHYLPLLRALPPSIRTLYYASDDYRSYVGWDADRMLELERDVLERVDAAVFVSSALERRARKEQPHVAGKLHVSMNATEERFFQTSNRVTVPSEAMRRPIVGVVGSVGDRIDFDLLLACAEMSDVGTVLVVGGGSSSDPAWDELRRHPKCCCVGPQPHSLIPAWMASLDVALIPYRQSAFNHYCSPMRLFDHLASGRPIVASDACDQISEFSDTVLISTGIASFIENVGAEIERLRMSGARERAIEQSAVARRHTWSARADHLRSILEDLAAA